VVLSPGVSWQEKQYLSATPGVSFWVLPAAKVIDVGIKRRNNKLKIPIVRGCFDIFKITSSKK
jgi:hypothetical protein